MKKQTILIVSAFAVLFCATAFARERQTRDEKIERYEILYDRDVIEGEIQPAFAQVEETETEQDFALAEETETEQILAQAEETETEQILYFEDEEQLYLPEAVSRLDEMAADDEEAGAFRDVLSQMMRCQGIYVQEKEQNSSGNVYTAEVEIFLRHGIPTCIIDYDGYVGFLEESKVQESTSEEYTFETWPIGKMAGFGQQFYIAFDEKKMHIVWGEGNVENDLTKASGDANELEDVYIPFTETDTYQTIQEIIDQSFSKIDHKMTYDEDSRTLTVYLVLYENGRNLVLQNPSALDDLWDPFVDSCKGITETIKTALNLTTNEGVADFTKAHCVFVAVDRLKEDDTYDQTEIWATIKDGEVVYDFLKESSFSSEQPSQSTVPSLPASGDSSSYSASSGERNALQKAKDYLNVMHFSYQGLTEQLEFEGFSHSEAIYAVDHCGADWNAQAAGKARDYLDVMAFSYDGLVEQLEFEGFTHEQAVYGANKEY